MDECRFCSGKPVKAGYSFGGGYNTMHMMIGWLAGSDDDDDDEDVIEGVQLKRGNLMIFDSSSGEYKRLGVEINFCPLCGKKLEEKKEEEDV